MSALSAVLLTFSFEFSLLFFSISLTKPHHVEHFRDRLFKPIIKVEILMTKIKL